MVDVQDTPSSELEVAPEGLGVGWVTQVDPFHASARVTLGPELLCVSPTATQAMVEVQDTPRSPLEIAPGGLGVGWVTQVDPFHASARVTRSPNLFDDAPTAMHAEALVQERAIRMPFGAVGLGVLTIDHPDAARS